MLCPECKFENPDNFNFCGNCGSKISQLKTVAHDHTGIADKSYSFRKEERRYITVMFCDMVGSTILSEQLDPEEFREVLHVYQDASAHVVQRYEGYLAQFLGDGILVYFGFPAAHEDDAQRSVHCALDIIKEMQNLSNLQEKDKGIRLGVRIGIHTGLVVLSEIGDLRKRELLALGKAPNIAARLQALAEPDTVVVSNRTYRLIKSFFSCQSLGTHTLKGVTRPIEVFQVFHESDLQSRIDIAITTGLTPLVGRQAEVKKLLRCWTSVQKGKGCVALIVGEAGIGKTRLLRVFEEKIKDKPHTWLVCSCHSYYQNSAFYPIINLIQKQLNFEPNDTHQQKMEKIKEALSRYQFDIDETLPLLASLLSIPVTERRRLNLSPQKQKQKTIQLLIDWILRIAARRPVLFVLENLHWADPSTLEHVSQIMEHVEEAKIMVILTFHPRFKPPQMKKARLTEIILRRLARKQVEMLVSEVIGKEKIPNEVLDLVLEKTDGVPLFVEELTKMLQDSGILTDAEEQSNLNTIFSQFEIPETLQETLMARLDRLGAVKEVVQIAAVLGREFPFELIKSVAPFDEEVLLEELESLVEAEILDREGDYPEIKYIFKQALIQDAAYNSLLKSTRQHYHSTVARLIEEEFTSHAQKHPEVLAHHYTKAGFYTKAIALLTKAGQVALANSANLEAIHHLKRGLRLLSKIPDSKHKKQQELLLQITLGVPLIAIKGFAAAEVCKAYERARELSQEVGDIPHLFPALHGLYRYYLLHGDVQTAFTFTELLLSWAQTSKKSDFLLEAQRASGSTHFHLGDFATSEHHLTQGAKLYNPKEHSKHSLLYGTDPKTVCLSYASLAQNILGYPDQALTTGKEAIRWAKKLSHPFSQAMGLNHHAWLHQYRNEPDSVERICKELVELSKYQFFAFWLAAAMIFLGWALAQKDKRNGIKQMMEGVAAFRKTGSELVSPYFLSLIAETYLSMGQTRECKRYLRQAETLAKENGEHFYDAELLRLRGESEKENPKRAENHFLKAIETARKQKAKSFELRAAMSLARLYQNQNKEQEAIQLVQKLYSWFTEGFDTVDLMEARRLIGKS